MLLAVRKLLWYSNRAFSGWVCLGMGWFACIKLGFVPDDRQSSMGMVWSAWDTHRFCAWESHALLSWHMAWLRHTLKTGLPADP